MTCVPLYYRDIIQIVEDNTRITAEDMENAPLIRDFDPAAIALAIEHIEASSNGHNVQIDLPEEDPLVTFAFETLLRPGVPAHIALIARYIVAYLEAPVISDEFGLDSDNGRRRWKENITLTSPADLRPAVICLLKSNQLSGNGLHKAITILLEYAEREGAQHLDLPDESIAQLSNLLLFVNARAQGTPIITDQALIATAKVTLTDVLVGLACTQVQQPHM